MTPTKIKAALVELAAEVGPSAYAGLVMAHNMHPEVHLCLHPEGICGSHRIAVSDATFEGGFKKLRAAWEKEKLLADKNATRKMALAIIEITADVGACTDAALRGRDFYQAQIDRIGASACEEATRLAAGGPFSIVSTVGANAEAA